MAEFIGRRREWGRQRRKRRRHRLNAGNGLATEESNRNLEDLANYGCDDMSGCTVEELHDQQQEDTDRSFARTSIRFLEVDGDGELQTLSESPTSFTRFTSQILSLSESNGVLDSESDGSDGKASKLRAIRRLWEDPSSEFTSVEPAEVRRFLSRPAGFTYEIMEVSVDGQIREMKVARGDLLAATSLRPRDLRAVAVEPLPGSDAGPVLASRRNTLLLGLGGIRAVVEQDRALLFGPPSRDRIRFLRVLENQRRASPGGCFRMLVVESALLALSRRLDARLLEIREATEPKLRAPPVLREPDLEEVRQLRRSLVRCASQAAAVSSALLSRLDGDEAALLAGDEADAATVDEWEAVLEVYLQAFSELSRECTSLLQDIEDFEGSASLALQARRLRVEQFELALVISSVSLSAGGIVPGFFGMNLTNTVESNEFAFSATVSLTFVVTLMLMFFLRFAASKQGFLI